MNAEECAKEITEKIDCPECPADFHETILPLIQQCVDDQTAELQVEIKRLKEELVQSKIKEVADVELPDGRVMKFVTPETMKEIARLQAIVDKLPKYADTGEPIHIDSVVYYWLPWDGVCRGTVVGMDLRDSCDRHLICREEGATPGLCRIPNVSICCSTYEAAEAAKENEDGEQ